MASSSAVKAEYIEPVEIESKILELCTQYPNGLPDGELQRLLPTEDPSQRAAAINALLTRAKIDLIKVGSNLLYKIRDAQAASKMKGSDREERVVYQIIQEAGAKGIWIRDIRLKSNLPQAQLTKILRAMETKKLIKSVKAVGATRKKVYMLYEIDPDPSLTGGTFYSGQDFDIEFVSLLSQQCLKYLELKTRMAAEKNTGPLAQKKASFVTASEVMEHIKQLRISNVDLKPADLDSVLNTLVWDGKAERTVGNSGVLLYRSIPSLLSPCGLVRIPCGMCPVFDDCYPGFAISPATCEYMKEWLDS